MDKSNVEKSEAKELQIVVFRLMNEEYGIKISQVKEIIRISNITPIPKSPSFIEGVINLRGQIIAVMDLSKKFAFDAPKRTEKARIVIIEVENNTIGLIVDEVPEVLRISTDDIEPTPTAIDSGIHQKFIDGVGKLENRLIIILNVERILNKDEIEEIDVVAKATK